MSLHFNNKAIATGLAKCKVCGLKIKKGLICVYAHGYQTSGHCHLKCPEVKQ
jgi:hypothetical protein